MEEELIVADNITQQLVFLGIELLVVFIMFLIYYVIFKYGRKVEIIRKFLSLPIVQYLLMDLQVILSNFFKLKAKKKMKEKGIGENSEADEYMPPYILQKYGSEARKLSRDALNKLIELEQPVQEYPHSNSHREYKKQPPRQEQPASGRGPNLRDIDDID